MLSRDIAKRERLWQKKEEEEKLQVLVKWINEIEFLILSLSQSDYFGSFFPLVWTLSLSTFLFQQNWFYYFTDWVTFENLLWIFFNLRICAWSIAMYCILNFSIYIIRSEKNWMAFCKNLNLNKNYSTWLTW